MVHVHTTEDAYVAPAYAGRLGHSPVPKNRMPDNSAPPEAVYRMIRQASDESGHAVGVLVDLQGPKIRLGRFAAGPVTLAAGQEFTITGQDVTGDQNEVSVSYPALAGDVRPGRHLLVDDGRVVLEVTAVQGERVRTRVLVGGPVSDHKGLNLPGVRSACRP